MMYNFSQKVKKKKITVFEKKRKWEKEKIDLLKDFFFPIHVGEKKIIKMCVCKNSDSWGCLATKFKKCEASFWQSVHASQHDI